MCDQISDAILDACFDCGWGWAFSGKDPSKVETEKIVEAIKKNFDLTPDGIIKTLDLKKPIFKKTATWGHFGRSDVSWEKIDKVEIFQNLI